MNPGRYFTGFIKALGLDQNWREYFDLTGSGFQRSFLTIPLALPFFYLCVLALHKQNLAVLALNPDFEGPLPALISPLSFVVISLAFGFSFSALAYGLSLAFGKLEHYRAWVTVRHWGFFFWAVIVSLFLGATYIGLIPFAAIIPILFILYMATLVIDIRLAQKIGGFDWGGAALVGCMTTALGLTIILFGMTRLA